MKKISNIILVLVVCVCLSLPFAGCVTYQNSENCDGIVKGYECLGEKAISITFPDEEQWTVMEIEITFDTKKDIYYPFILVSQSYFDYYNCSTIDEIFKNQEFIDTYSISTLLKVKNGKAIFQMNTAFELNTSVYFYEGVEENSGTIKIEDFTNYIGYFKYN